MKILSQLFSHEFNYAITWTIIHSLWQCTLIALFIAISYAFTKKSSASLRYWINCAGLLSCALTSGATFYVNFYDSVVIEIVKTDYIAAVSPNISQVHFQTLSDFINQHINQIAFIWLTGFALYVSKYIAEYCYCQHIKNNRFTEPKQNLQKIFNDLKTTLNLHNNIQLRISHIVDIPCVIGHFKPIILLPVGLVLGLSAKQLEVILLHELGHVRRNDYLISGLQNLISVFYFFNPFARWISSKIDEERENACDDIAVSQCKDPLFYAHTLKEFAEMNNTYSPAIAMTGRKNLLFNRIKRLFISDASFAKTYGKLLTLMVFILASVGYSVTGYSEEKKPETDTFSIKIENEPLSTLLKLTEGYCADIKGKIALKHPDQTISGSFPDLECRSVEYMIKGLDNSLNQSVTGIVIDEKNIPLKTLINKIEGYCPELKGKITINNPNTLVGFKAESLPCTGIQDTIKRMDTSENGQSVRIGKIEKIEVKEPTEYEKAFHKELNFPKEIVDKGYTGDCTLTFAVDTNGLARDIVPACVSPNDEQKRYFENLINNTVKRIKFPIKIQDGDAVIAKGISVRIKWRNETKAVISSTITASASTTPQSNDLSEKAIETNQQTEDGDFKAGLSINNEANIASYKDIEFAPLFLGKKLIDTTDAKSYRYAQREFGGFDRKFISATNDSLLKAIKNDKSSLLNPNGTKSLIGEIYIFKIKPYWERELFPYTENGNGANAATTQGTKKFPFRANVFLGVVLKDAESKEIIALLKDQFTHEESKTWFNNMSDKQKSRFINEKIVANIRESVNKTTSGLIAFSQHRSPLSETQSSSHLISFDAQSFKTQEESELGASQFDSKENIVNYGSIELASVDFSDTKLICENLTALKYSEYLFDKENPKYLEKLKKEVISQFKKSKTEDEGDLTGNLKWIAEIKLTDINLYWNKVNSNASGFETTSEAIKNPSTLDSIGSKNSIQFHHSPINYTELMGDVKFQILLRDEKSNEVLAKLDKVSDVHLGSLANFTSKKDQQDVILREIYRPMLAKAFSDLYASLGAMKKKSKIASNPKTKDLSMMEKSLTSFAKSN